MWEKASAKTCGILHPTYYMAHCLAKRSKPLHLLVDADFARHYELKDKVILPIRESLGEENDIPYLLFDYFCEQRNH